MQGDPVARGHLADHFAGHPAYQQRGSGGVVVDRDVGFGQHLPQQVQLRAADPDAVGAADELADRVTRSAGRGRSPPGVRRCRAISLYQVARHEHRAALAASVLNRLRSQRMPSGSRPLTGSSNSSTGGSPSSAAAMPRRWCMPSEKLPDPLRRPRRVRPDRAPRRPGGPGMPLRLREPEQVRARRPAVDGRPAPAARRPCRSGSSTRDRAGRPSGAVRGRAVEPEDHPHRRGLARAVRPEETGHSTRFDGERQVVAARVRPNILVSPANSIIASILSPCGGLRLHRCGRRLGRLCGGRRLATESSASVLLIEAGGSERLSDDSRAAARAHAVRDLVGLGVPDRAGVGLCRSADRAAAWPSTRRLQRNERHVLGQGQ